jgi:serine/threonine protein phosphatase 1
MMFQPLLDRLRGKRPAPKQGIPKGRTVYAVGDIHGRADLLLRLYALILEDAGKTGPSEKTIIYLGDYLDRGPYVRETLDLLTSDPLRGFDSHYLLGNHERLFLSFLEDPRTLQLWMDLGGQSTLLSYGVQPPGSGFPPQRAEQIRREIITAMPRKHHRFLHQLELYLQLGDYLFVHAGIRPGISLEKQNAEDLLWIRDEFLASKAEHPLRVVHGHTIREEIQNRPNRIGIDTGAYATGNLTCAVFENFQVRFLSTATTAQQP